MRVFKLYGRTLYKYIEGEPHLPVRENRLTVETNEHVLHLSFLSDFGGYEVRENLNKSVFTKAVMQIINSERNISDTITYYHGLIRDLEFHIYKDTVRLIFRVRSDYTRHRCDVVEITQFEFLKLSYFLQDRVGDTQTDKIHITPELKEAVVKYIDALEASKEVRIKQAEEKILSVFKGELIK